MLTTRFTTLVGCSIPVQQAGRGGVATPELAAAVALWLAPDRQSAEARRVPGRTCAAKINPSGQRRSFAFALETPLPRFSTGRDLGKGAGSKPR